MENTQEKIYEKFISFSNDIENIEKDGINPHFKSKYTTLDEIFKKIKASCKKHQVRVFNKVESSVLDNGSLYIEVTPVFMCQYGIYEGGTFRCISTNQIQNNGSVITYAKRYTISAFLGIAADEDDDGNAGMQGVQVVNTNPTGIKKVNTVAENKIKSPNEILKDEIRNMTRETAYVVNRKVLKCNDDNLIKGYHKKLHQLGLIIDDKGSIVNDSEHEGEELPFNLPPFEEIIKQ